jgi:nucleotide-binding universal stress UspA family protein
MKKLLVAYDGSKQAEKSFELASQMALNFNAS